MSVVAWTVDSSSVVAVWRRDGHRMKRRGKSSRLEKRDGEMEREREKGDRERKGEGEKEKREKREGEHANKAEAMRHKSARDDEMPVEG